jgi:PGF-CTERM protein
MATSSGTQHKRRNISTSDILLNRHQITPILLQARIKFDKNGKQTWSKTFGENDGVWLCFCSVQQTTDGGYILAGPSRTNLVKTDAKGNEQWSKALGESSVPNSVQQTTDGGYILTGKMGYGMNAAAFLIKTDGDGNQQWVKTFGDEQGSWAWSVQQTFDGGYVFAGIIAAEETDDIDLWVVKTDSDGNMLWDRTFGGTDADWAWSVQQTSDGGYIVAGKTESYGSGGDDVWLIKLEGTGEVPATEKTSKKPVAPDIEKPPEKSIPGFGALGAMFGVFAIFFLQRRRA